MSDLDSAHPKEPWKPIAFPLFMGGVVLLFSLFPAKEVFAPNCPGGCAHERTRKKFPIEEVTPTAQPGPLPSYSSQWINLTDTPLSSCEGYGFPCSAEGDCCSGLACMSSKCCVTVGNSCSPLIVPHRRQHPLMIVALARYALMEGAQSAG